LAGLLRQSVFGRLAGDEDVNDAERLCRDPAMRWVVGDRAITGSAASARQMGRLEAKWLSRPENLGARAVPARHGRYVTFQMAEVALSHAPPAPA
jgi:hypothetical protein